VQTGRLFSDKISRRKHRLIFAYQTNVLYIHFIRIKFGFGTAFQISTEFGCDIF